jgi:hypothetical protein
MSWFSRKFTKSDIIDNKQVVQEYFEHKEQQRLLQEKELAEFWKEYQEDERGA